MKLYVFNMDPSPYGIYRTLEEQTHYDGFVAYWRYFKLNKDGTYYRDDNGNYVYKPEWISIPDPYLKPNLPPPPPKPETNSGFEAILERFKRSEDGFYFIDPDTNDVVLDQRWVIQPICNLTLTAGNDE